MSIWTDTAFWIKLIVGVALAYHVWLRRRSRSSRRTPSNRHATRSQTYERAGMIGLIICFAAFFTWLSLETFPRLLWLSRAFMYLTYVALVGAFIFAGAAGWARGGEILGEDKNPDVGRRQPPN